MKKSSIRQFVWSLLRRFALAIFIFFASLKNKAAKVVGITSTSGKLSKNFNFSLRLCITLVLLGSSFSALGQYYYFDSTTTSKPAPYKQGCTGELLVRINMESHPIGARAGLLRLIFDPLHFRYDLSLTGTILRTTLFAPYDDAFAAWSSDGSPSRVESTSQTQLQIDRSNALINYQGNGGRYGTVTFVPVYNAGIYTGFFAMFYNGITDTTSLSQVGGINIINPVSQTPYLTGEYVVIQEPCAPDTANPLIDVTVPLTGTKKSYISGITLSLTDDSSNGAIPYIWTGGIWTGNTRGVSNQYGIDLSTFALSISGNGTGRTFIGNQFNTGGGSASLSSLPYGKTWQFLDKDYYVTIVSGELFDYGIEKTITITSSVQDRLGHVFNFSRSVNQAVPPSAMGTFSPSAGARFINANAPVKLGIQDDWAGVDSGTIVVTLSGINGSSYGPYDFTGDALNLSAVVGQANYPDYFITISGHVAFPSSGAINVHVYAVDKAGTEDNIADYSFSTRPSCAQLGCCNQVSRQTGTNVPVLYDPATITISGGVNPRFTIGSDGTGYIDCNLPVAGMSIYNGAGTSSGSALFVGFVNGNELIFSGASNIRAVLDGNTIYLSTIFVPPPFIPGGGGGGGGGILVIKDDCLSPRSSLPGANPSGIDNSPSFYDDTCEAMVHEAAPGCPVEDSPYDDELTEAFQEAYALGITNKCPIENARLKDPLKRKELVKMLVFFSVKVLGVMPDTTKIGCDIYGDMKNASDEMKFYTKMGCQLEVMGMDPDGVTPMKNFYPDQTVTRAQFGTTLSRLIFGRQFNAEKPYRYTKHLEALKKFGIIKVVVPDLKETRGFVLLMFSRTRASGLVEQYRLSAAAKNGAVALKQ